MFGKKQRKSQPIQKSEAKDFKVPNGTAIEVQGLWFYVMGGKKYSIISERVLWSQRYPRVINVTVKCANRIPNAVAKIGFREGQVIRDISDQSLYLISDSKRRKIANPDFIKLYDIQDQDILVVSHEEVLLHKGGEEINGL